MGTLLRCKCEAYMDISISRNVAISATDFDGFELNVIMTLLGELQAFVYTESNFSNPGDVFLRFSSFIRRHDNRSDYAKRINELRKKDIIYRYDTVGVPKMTIITGLFSSVLLTTGGVIARVSPDAIPWLLYIGRGVGFVRAEPHVFYGLKSVFHKRLYLLLIAKIYKNTFSVQVDVEDLCKKLGKPEGMSIAAFLSRYIYTFDAKLTSLKSSFTFACQKGFRGKTGAGRPSLDSLKLQFNLRPEFIKTYQDVESRFLSILQSHYSVLKQNNKEMRMLSDIYKQLCDNNLCAVFIHAMSKYINDSSYTLEHQANTMNVILRDRFGINIFSANSKII